MKNDKCEKSEWTKPVLVSENINAGTKAGIFSAALPNEGNTGEGAPGLYNLSS